MDAIAPSEEVVAVLRAISRAGFDYDATKELGTAAGWSLADDEKDLGYVQYEIPQAGGTVAHRLLTILFGKAGEAPSGFVALFYHDDYDVERRSFDQAFLSLVGPLSAILGQPACSGTYTFSHRQDWPYSYAGWPLEDVTFLLVQDELDIQFGMDITLWIQPSGTPVAVPVAD